MGLTLRELRPTGPTLDFAYLPFAEYRRYLARDAAGIDLDQMKGFGGDTEWPPYETQPLRYLLNHSDCDGELWSWECEALAPILRAFRPLADWPDWMVRHHEVLTEMVARVAEHGGVISFR